MCLLGLSSLSISATDFCEGWASVLALSPLPISFLKWGPTRFHVSQEYMAMKAVGDVQLRLWPKSSKQ